MTRSLLMGVVRGIGSHFPLGVTRYTARSARVGVSHAMARYLSVVNSLAMTRSEVQGSRGTGARFHRWDDCLDQARFSDTGDTVD